MPNLEPFAVIGGDRRMEYLAKFLFQIHPVIRWHTGQSSDALKEAMAVGHHLLCPVPFSTDIARQVIPLLHKEHCSLFGGLIPQSVRQKCTELGIPYFDWMEMEDVVMPNAILTAEGAIAEAILNGGHSLSSAHCLVIGYGRCGQNLARRLHYLAKTVTVAARNPIQRLTAQSEGFSTLFLEKLETNLSQFDLLFNTVPAMVLPEKYTRTLSPDAVLLDLASGPIEAHAEPGLFRGKMLSCPGLPGKYFSKDAGEILAYATLSRLSEAGILTQ